MSWTNGAKRGVTVAIVVAVTSALIVGGVVAGSFDWSASAPTLGDAILEEPSVQVAEIPSADGLVKRGVFAQVTSTGHFCLWDAASPNSKTRGGGCNSADEPLGGRPLRVSLTYDGGPAIASVTDARLIGLASLDVASVEIVMSDGSTRTVPLRRAAVGGRRFEAFGFRVRKNDLRRGIGPVAVVAQDANGTEIHRETTSLGG